MKRILLTFLLLPFTAAIAADGYTSRSVSLRTGPDVGYPRIMTLPANTRVNIYGCLDDWSWCDVQGRQQRGWVSGELVDYSYYNQRYGVYDYGPQLDLPILSFVLGSYWRSHYRYRPWYSQRNHWTHYSNTYRPRPPRPPIQIQPPRPGQPSIQPPRPPIQIQPIRPGQPSIQPPRPPIQIQPPRPGQPSIQPPRPPIQVQPTRPQIQPAVQPARPQVQPTVQPARQTIQPAVQPQSVGPAMVNRKD